jgi:O-antigen/teichoic acid export membrane protein
VHISWECKRNIAIFRCSTDTEDMKERSLFANSAWGIITQGLRGLAGLLFIPMVVSNIGVAGYGLFTLLMLLSYYQGLVQQADLGYFGFLVNWMAKEANSRDSNGLRMRIGTSISLLFAINILLWLLSYFLSAQVVYIFKVSPESSGSFLNALNFVFLGNFFSIIANVAGSVWLSKHRNVFFKRIEVGSYFLFIFLSFVFLRIESSLRAIVLAYLASQIFLAGRMWFATFKSFSIQLNPGKVDFSLLRKDWPSWKPFISSRLNNMAQRQSDMTLISLLLGPQFLAVYDISMKIPSVLKTLLGRIGEALAPFASKRSAATDMPFIKKLSEKLVALEIALGLIGVVTFFYFGEDLCQLWLGVEQREIGRNFFLASWLNVTVPPLSVLFAILIAQNRRDSELTWYPTLVSLANIGLTIPVTMYFGVRGTILLTVIQFFVLSMMCVRWARIDFHFNFLSGWKIWLKALLAAGTVTGVGRYYISKLEMDSAQFIFQFAAMELILVAILWILLRKDISDLRRQMQTKA